MAIIGEMRDSAGLLVAGKMDALFNPDSQREYRTAPGFRWSRVNSKSFHFDTIDGKREVVLNPDYNQWFVEPITAVGRIQQFFSGIVSMSAKQKCSNCALREDCERRID